MAHDDDNEDWLYSEPVQHVVDPRRLVEETCRCKHSRAGHGGVAGHGECLVMGCDCTRYTWTNPNMTKPRCYCCDDEATTTTTDGLRVCRFHAPEQDDGS